jgi:ParB family chromosome partitioning protein
LHCGFVENKKFSFIRLTQIPIDKISLHPDYPREWNISPEKWKDSIKELKDSMESCGLIEEIVVRPYEGGYQLILGGRRFLAAKELGWSRIRGKSCNLSDDEALKVMLISNIQQEDLTLFEEASALQKLHKKGLRQESIGKMIGKSRDYVGSRLRLFTYPDDIIENVRRGTLTLTHAEYLLQVPDAEQRGILIEKCKNGLSTRDLKKAIERILNPPPPETLPKKLKSYERQVRRITRLLETVEKEELRPSSEVLSALQTALEGLLSLIEAAQASEPLARAA